MLEDRTGDYLRRYQNMQRIGALNTSVYKHWHTVSAVLLGALFLVLTIPSRLANPFAESTISALAPDGVRIATRSQVASDPGPIQLNTSAFRDGPFTIEFLIRPDDLSGKTIATIVSYSTGDTFNWSVEQHGTSLVVLYRNRGLRFSDVFASSRPQQFVIIVTRQDGTLIQNGEWVAAQAWSGDAAPWANEARFTVGNLDSGDYPWRGDIRRFALYGQRLEMSNVMRHYGPGPGETRTPQPALWLSARDISNLELKGAADDLIPLHVHRWPWALKLRNLFDARHQDINRRDVILNILMTCLLGVSIAGCTSRERPIRAAVYVTCAVCLLSLTVEALQFFSPNRVASLVDVATNTLGALLGATGWLVFTRLQPENTGRPDLPADDRRP